jgi:hypothetical protein
MALPMCAAAQGVSRDTVLDAVKRDTAHVAAAVRAANTIVNDVRALLKDQGSIEDPYFAAHDPWVFVRTLCGSPAPSKKPDPSRAPD